MGWHCLRAGVKSGRARDGPSCRRPGRRVHPATERPAAADRLDRRRGADLREAASASRARRTVPRGVRGHPYADAARGSHSPARRRRAGAVNGDTDLARQIGRLEAQVANLERDAIEIKGDLKALVATANQARGGWKTLILVAGAAGAAGALASKVVGLVGLVR